MARLISPLGIVVNVSDEKAARLGWESVEGSAPAAPSPAPAPEPEVAIAVESAPAVAAPIEEPVAEHKRRGLFKKND